ncbi:MAG TPA: molybdenum cofactor guanylyltransferase [Ktedonobacteraceae bacterium]
MMDAVSALILAGGRSRRMGRDKAFLSLPDDERRTAQLSFAEQLGTLLSSLCPEVIFVARDPAQCAGQNLSGVCIVFDEVPDYGPLMGLYSGLRAMQTSHALVVAVDMPFVQPALLAFLLSQPLDEAILMPVVAEMPQVLLAIYPRALLPLIENRLRSGRRDPRSLLDIAPVRYIPEAQLRQIDPQLRSFINLNTPEDLTRFP